MQEGKLKPDDMCLNLSLGTNTSMMANCLVFCDVQSLVLGPNEMFKFV